MCDGAEVDPVGVREIAERMGVQAATVSMWRRRALMPEPRWNRSGVDLWLWSDFDDFEARRAELRSKRWAKTLEMRAADRAAGRAGGG